MDEKSLEYIEHSGGQKPPCPVKESLNRQAQVLRALPESLHEAIGGILYDISAGITQKKATKDIKFPGNGGVSIDVIPSNIKCSCARTLIVYIYDRDSIEERIREGLDYAMLTCLGVTREIYFLTTQWEEYGIQLLAGYIELVRRSSVQVNFLYITKKGIAVMPA